MYVDIVYYRFTHFERLTSKRLCQICSISWQVCKATDGPYRTSSSLAFVNSKLEQKNKTTTKQHKTQQSHLTNKTSDQLYGILESTFGQQIIHIHFYVQFTMHVFFEHANATPWGLSQNSITEPQNFEADMLTAKWA